MKMVNKLISLRVSNNLINETNQVIDIAGFNSLQEFIRDAWRNSLKEYKLAIAKKELSKLYGFAKGKNLKIKSKKEVEEYLKKNFL